MADETTEETTPEPEGPEDEAAAAPQESAGEERIQDLSHQLAEARRLLNQTQQQMQGVIAQQHAAQQVQGEPIVGWQPDWEQNPGMVALRQTVAQRDQELAALKQTALGLMNETDKIQSERAMTKQYENGSELWDKYEAAVEQEFNQALQAGRAESRQKLLPLVVARAGEQLVERGAAQSAQTTRTRKRAAQAAQIETATPARKGDTGPPKKTMKEMTPEERRAALRGYAEERMRVGRVI
jgi:hypothetical protein